MAKPKQPITSLEAKGTLANAITFSKVRGTSLARSKPNPGQPNTLAQTYRLWLFKDALLSWQTLTPTQKAAWRPIASRHHTTPMAAYCSYYLNTQPGLIARWHMDILSAGQTPDSSFNHLPLTNVNATQTTGPINKAFNFNGINQYLWRANHTLLNPSTAISIECFFRVTSDNNDEQGLVCKRDGAVNGYSVIVRADMIPIHIEWAVRTTNLKLAYFNPITTGQWYHLACTYNGAALRIYVNGTLRTTLAGAGAIVANADPLKVGAWSPAHPHFPGDLDEVALYDYALDAATIAAHAARHYP